MIVKAKGVKTRKRPTGGPVMLALSSFWRSERAVDLAVAEAGRGGSLVVVFVVDVDLPRHLVGRDLRALPGPKDSYERELFGESGSEARRASSLPIGVPFRPSATTGSGPGSIGWWPARSRPSCPSPPWPGP